MQKCAYYAGYKLFITQRGGKIAERRNRVQNLPPHEVVLGSLILVPHGDLKLLILVIVQVQIELLQPRGRQTLVNHLALVLLAP